MTPLYAFDLSSKYKLFTHEVKAKKDPVSGDLLIPAYATSKPILAEKDGYARGFVDGQWQYFIDQRGAEYWGESGTKHTISEVGEEVPESALFEAPPEPEPTAEELKEKAITQREAAYKNESDPFFLEAMRKEASGNIEGAAVARAAGLVAVESIHERFSMNKSV